MMGIIEKLNKEWYGLLEDEIVSGYFCDLLSFVDKEYQNNIIYPSRDLVFNAFNLTTPKNVKVVILGQDPCMI